MAQALAQAASRFPNLTAPTLSTHLLAPREARLATAVYRTAMQRWITLEYLLDRCLNQPVPGLEPALRGVLLAGGAQIVFFDRLPVHAVVDESVDLARSMVRAGAGGLTNAVLRRLSQMIHQRSMGQPWAPAADRLPYEAGCVTLCGEALPAPSPNYARYLSVATSHPVALVRRWVQAFGQERATRICCHGVLTAPTLVAMERSSETIYGDPLGASCGQAHAQRGFWLWQGRGGELEVFLDRHADRRVQDPASAKAIQATATLSPRRCVDCCAGRGTKTRQLAALHPQAQIIATDIDPNRLAQLGQVFHGHPRVTVVPLDAVEAACGLHAADLVVLDVPCSNTGVLGRRPEARYRFNQRALDSLVVLQRELIQQAARLLGPNSHLLYSTCSLEPQENHDQARWVAQRYASQLVAESQLLPGGAGTTYHGGSYFALLRWGGG